MKEKLGYVVKKNKQIHRIIVSSKGRSLVFDTNKKIKAIVGESLGVFPHFKPILHIAFLIVVYISHTQILPHVIKNSKWFLQSMRKILNLNAVQQISRK